LLPGLAAIHAAEDTALLVRSPGMAKGRHVDDVRVVGVDGDVTDVAGVLQTHVLPGLAPVGGFVDAVTVRDVAADVRLAGTNVDDVGVRLRDGDCPDGRGVQVAVGDVEPVCATVGRLPDTATDTTEVERRFFRRVTGNR